MRSPFWRLPPEIRDMICFESVLTIDDRLALSIALNKPEEEYALVHDYLVEHLQGNGASVVVVQTLYHTGSPTRGSADWARYAACKQARYDNPNLELDGTCLAVPYDNRENALGLTLWAEFLFEVCNFNFLSWVASVGDADDFDHIDSFGSGSDDSPSKKSFYRPSNTETQRMILAVHQFETFCALLGEEQGTMSFEVATSLASHFFRNLTPWEKEQLLCIAEILGELYDWGTYAILRVILFLGS
jgi:hypothetical protein